MNTIELAKSSRSSCRTCKEKIEKLEPRLGVEQEMRQGDRSFTAMRWHHLECAMDSLPEEVSQAEINAELSEDLIEKIDKIRDKQTESSFDIKGIAELTQSGISVNTEAVVLRALKTRKTIDKEENEMKSRTIYVEDNEQKRKVVVHGENTAIKVEKGDHIVIIRGKTSIGSDEKIQVIAGDSSQILINPKPDQLAQFSEVKIFVASGWSRPTGSKVEFEYAKSSRAKCPACKEKILKSELKVVKPAWMENEQTKQKFPGSFSYHVMCALEDEHSEDMLCEAISRLSPELLLENREILTKLQDDLLECQAKNLLTKLLV
ncbi:MAG: hypothetical protein ACW98K_11805 [Candidatus Kariarchaeaceae archaeon]|jgi:DNA-directed RNA polymerase subunit M/transcription elongation factor TFIIS